jgi:hypothetical protein
MAVSAYRDPWIAPLRKVDCITEKGLTTVSLSICNQLPLTDQLAVSSVSSGGLVILPTDACIAVGYQ